MGLDIVDLLHLLNYFFTELKIFTCVFMSFILTFFLCFDPETNRNVGFRIENINILIVLCYQISYIIPKVDTK